MLSYIKRKVNNIISNGRLSLIKNYLGQEISIGKKCQLEHSSLNGEIYIGKGCQLRYSVLNGKISVGENCKLYKANLNGNILVGRSTSLWGPNLSMHSSLNPIRIGNFCSIAKNVTFQEYNHDYKRFSTYFVEANVLDNSKGHKEEIVSNGPIQVEHDVWIGAHCIILGGAQISTGAVIAANSLVTGYVPPYAIVGGSPAKILKYRFDENVRKKLLKTEWWNWKRKKIKQNIEILNEIVS